MNKKTLMYAAIAFVLSFALTFILIRNYKKNKHQETVEHLEVKE